MTHFIYCPNCKAPLTEQLEGDEPRRGCSQRCGFVHYDNPVPVVAAVVEHEGLVVLARNRAWPVEFFGLITGFLERGETPEQGVLREVKEELDLDATSATLIGVYAFERMNQLIIGYHVAATGAIKLNEELVDYRRVPPDQCRVWPAGTGFALRDWLRARGHEPQMMSLPFDKPRPESAA